MRRPKFKPGDLVKMSKIGQTRYPKTQFITGVVRQVDEYGVSVKRYLYRGHELTWWDQSDWTKWSGNLEIR